MPEAANQHSGWLIYALGGGWGHLSRALAIGRVASRERPVTVLSNSPYAEFVAARQRECRIVQLPPTWPITEIRTATTRLVAGFRGSALIVDTFPRGIGGELAGILSGLSAHKVLVVRDLAPRYVEAKSLRPFILASYTMAIAPEDAFPNSLNDLPGVVRTPPWLVRDASELPSRTSARARLGVFDDHQPLVLVCASGSPEEAAWFGEATALLAESLPDAAVRCIAACLPPRCPPRLHHQYWPAIELLPAADLVLAGGGYHLLRECEALGVNCLVRPWPRIYDRQERRAVAAMAVVQEPAEAAAAVKRMLTLRPPAAIAYENGAYEAVRRIAALES